MIIESNIRLSGLTNEQNEMYRRACNEIITKGDYPEISNWTAIYPRKMELGGLLYVTLGLVGEVGEVCNKVKKILRDHSHENKIPDGLRENILDEIGDVIWYAAQIGEWFGSDAFIYHPTNSGENLMSTDNMYILLLSISSISGLIANDVCFANKMVMDNPNYRVEIFKDITRRNFSGPIIGNTRKLLTLIGVLIKSLNSDTKYVLSKNVKKLLERMSQGKLHGEGDSR